MKFTKESFRRAARTFFQVAIPYILTNLAVVDFTSNKEIIKSAVMGVIISGAAFGLAAIMNMEKTEKEGVENGENE